MKVYRDNLKNAAAKAEVSIRFVGSDVGAWSYPTPYAVDDWDKARALIRQLIDQGWIVESQDLGYTCLAMDDHVMTVTASTGEVIFTLDTRKAIFAAPAH
jgi:hypothetical protein